MLKVSADPFITPKAPKKLVLSDDQERVYKRIVNFLMDPAQSHLVVQGHAGTGKTTLLLHLLQNMYKLDKLRSLTGDNVQSRSLHLTATTNKAAGVLQQITGYPAQTLHSKLGLVLERDPTTYKQQLVTTYRTRTINDGFVCIDEPSMMDDDLLDLYNHQLENTKTLFLGDPYQLRPVNSYNIPVFNAGYPTVVLDQILRQQADNPIIQFCSLCRNAVTSGVFFKFKADGKHILHVDRLDYERRLIADFSRPDSVPGDAKALAWRNKTAIALNKNIKQHIKGTHAMSVGDYAVVNNTVRSGNRVIRTDTTVQITHIGNETTEYGLTGCTYQINNDKTFFMPAHNEEKSQLIKTLKKSDDIADKKKLARIDDEWIDLRDEYTCTVAKSQGSTYKRVYVDLDDINACFNRYDMARLLYVAASRASDQVIFTGNIQ